MNHDGWCMTLITVQHDPRALCVVLSCRDGIYDTIRYAARSETRETRLVYPLQLTSRSDRVHASSGAPLPTLTRLSQQHRR